MFFFFKLFFDTSHSSLLFQVPALQNNSISSLYPRAAPGGDVTTSYTPNSPPRRGIAGRKTAATPSTTPPHNNDSNSSNQVDNFPPDIGTDMFGE